MKAETMHYTSSDAAFLISIIGISSVVSRISIGRAVDKRWVGSVRVHGILLMLAGIVTGLVPLYNNYAILACYSVLYGLFIGKCGHFTVIASVDIVMALWTLLFELFYINIMYLGSTIPCTIALPRHKIHSTHTTQ